MVRKLTEKIKSWTAPRNAWLQVKKSHPIAQLPGSADEYLTTDWNHKRLDDNWQDNPTYEKQRERCDTQQLPSNNTSINDI